MKKLLFFCLFIIGTTHPYIKKTNCAKYCREAIADFDKKILEIKPNAIEPTFNKIKCIFDYTKLQAGETKGFNKKIISSVQKNTCKLGRCKDMQKQYRNHLMGKMSKMVLK